MKANILAIVLATAFFVVRAQDKITKANIIGKWQISTISTPNFMYYDVAKDSFDIKSDTFRIPIEIDEKNRSKIEDINKEMTDESKKSLINGFVRDNKPMMYIFNTNEMVSCGFSMEALESYVYIFDEQNAIVTIKYLKPNEVNSNLEVKYNVSVKNSLMVLETVIMPNKMMLGFRKIE